MDINSSMSTMKHFAVFFALVINVFSINIPVKQTNNHALMGNVAFQQKFDQKLHCIQFCKQMLACKSINYFPNEKICHINNKKADGIHTILTSLNGFIYIDADDIHQDYGGGCQNYSCQSNELCVVMQNASHTCYPLDPFGFSSKPNGCTSISCESWSWKYQECPVDNLGAGRVVSMTIRSQRYYCNFGLDKVYYGWKRNMVFVNNGCRATFDVCYTVF